jgi:aryl-alcohol dehydrogenase-like predicted oxidoreductase
MASTTTQASKANAAASGTFKIGGELAVHRLGFGAMRVSGPGIWGEPADRAEALRTLRQVPELGVNFVDTADSYGPDVSERLIREALHPYKGLVIATKGGLERPGPDRWVPNGRPEYLIGEAEKSLRNLGVAQIDLWQLHRIDPKVPAHEQFGAIKQLLDKRIIRFAGLSEASVDDIIAASKVFPVATVQNRYNLLDRTSEDVLAYCEEHGIGFIPWFCEVEGHARVDRRALWRNDRADRARLAIEAQSGDAADPGNLEGCAFGGERCRGEHQAVGLRFRRARSRGPGPLSAECHWHPQWPW